MTAWRIGATTRAYKAEDLDGNGAAGVPGRWNSVNQHVIYAAPTLAMAVLETAAHLRVTTLPLDRYVVRVDLPEPAWQARVQTQLADLPVGWDAVPGSILATEIGGHWYTSAQSLILELPSAIIPEESVLVINATHPDAGAPSSAVGVEDFAAEHRWRSMESRSWRCGKADLELAFLCHVVTHKSVD